MTLKTFLGGTALALFLTLPGTAALAEAYIEGDLPRRAEVGFSTTGSDVGVIIRNLGSETPAAKAGLQDGDMVLAINGTPADKDYVAEDILEKLDGGQEVTVSIRRNGAHQTVSFTPEAKPLEDIPEVDSYYGVVETSDGSRLRTIIARPEGTTGPLPAIFFTQWVSCGSLEYIPGNTSREILATLARDSGMALIRVERTASGDSEGPACHELDYDTELEHYFEAYQQLMQSPHIDAENIVVIGSSLGSTTAPLLAERIVESGGTVKGVAAQGGGAVTYLERMINFERNYLERRPEVDPDTIHEQMINRIKFNYEYLINDRNPDDIAADGPEMAAVRNDTLGLFPDHQYGRPFAWHQQAAKHNFLKAWLSFDAPVLVVFNEYDQYEQEHGHKMIVDQINRKHPGNAIYILQASVGHSQGTYPSIEAAYAGENGVQVYNLIANRYVRWLREIVSPGLE